MTQSQSESSWACILPVSERRPLPSGNSDLELLGSLPCGEAILAGENEVNLQKKAVTRKRDAVNNIRIPCCTYIYCSLITFEVTTVVTHLHFILLFLAAPRGLRDLCSPTWD